MKKIARLLMVLSVISAVSVYPEFATAEAKNIKISMVVWPGYAHAFIAQEKGFFKKYNVNVELLLKEEYAESMNLYKIGNADAFLGLLPDIIIMNAGGYHSKIVYIPDYTYTADGIIARPEFASLLDLKEKRVSFTGVNSFSHIFVVEALRRAGLEEEDVYFETIPAKDVLSALEQNRIDAGFTWDPFKTQALEKGYKVLVHTKDVPGIVVDVLAFSSKIVKERPDDIRAIVRSLLEARDYVFSNRDEAIKIMAEAEGMSKKEMATGLDGIHLLDLKENIDAMKKSEEPTSLYGAGRIISEFFMNRGQLSSTPDFDVIIEPGFLKR